MNLFVVQGGPSSYSRFFLPLDRHHVQVVPFTGLPEALADDPELVMFSLTSLAQLADFDRIHRTGALEGRRLAVGGQMLLCIKHPEDFRQHYGIDHLCVGHGARLVQALCHGEDVEAGVYQEATPFVQAHMLLETPELYRNGHELRLLFDFGCSWNKCLFCHHQYPDVSERMSVNAFEEIKRKIIYDSRIRRLHFIDNEFAIPFLVERILEDERLMAQIDYLYFFGLRCTPEVRLIEPYLERYREVVFDFRFGLEFVSQDLINRFRKGYHLQRFLADGAFLFDNSHPNLISNFYLMSGLPGMDRTYYQDLAQFTRRRSPTYFLLSYFLLDDTLRPRFEVFPEITVGTNIRLDEFNGMETLPPLETHYLHFNLDGQTQLEHFATKLAPTGILGQSTVLCDDFMLPFRLPTADRVRRVCAAARKAPNDDALDALGQIQTPFEEAGLRLEEMGFPELPALLGGLRFAAGYHSEALAAYRRAEAVSPTDGRINLRLALCLARTGALGAARSEYYKGVFKHIHHQADTVLGLAAVNDSDLQITYLAADGPRSSPLDQLEVLVLHHTRAEIDRQTLGRRLEQHAADDVDRSLAALAAFPLLVELDGLWLNLLTPWIQHQIDDLAVFWSR